MRNGQKSVVICPEGRFACPAQGIPYLSLQLSFRSMDWPAGEAAKLAKKMREKYGKWTLNENFGEA